MMLRRITMVEAVAITINGFVLAAIFYPVLTQNNRSSCGMVYGVNNAPLPHPVLRFHDPHQLRDVEVTADANGRFVHKDLAKIAYLSTNGYAVTRLIGNSKGAASYVFSQRGTQVFLFLDRSVNPVANVSLMFSPDPRTYRPPHPSCLNRTTDENGIVILTQVPMAARYLIQSTDKRWKVETIGPAQGAPDARFAYVPVTVVPAK